MRKFCMPAYSPFHTIFSILSKTFNMLHANAFYIVQFKIFQSGKKTLKFKIYMYFLQSHVTDKMEERADLTCSLQSDLQPLQKYFKLSI